PPTITSITPSSAFRTKPQPAVVTGTALSLGGTESTVARFGGVPGTQITIPTETMLQCNTPVGMAAGATVVQVSHSHGSASLPSTAFTAYSYPPVLASNDTALDGGAGSAPMAAQDGNRIHTVWVETGDVFHRASADGGSSWGSTQNLSNTTGAAEPQVVVNGQDVTVLWIGNSSSLLACFSSDGGATFSSGQIINPLAGGLPAARPRLCASGDRRYAVWLRGDPGLGAARLVATFSTDAGVTWAPTMLVDDGVANQAEHAIVCDGETAWLTFTDERQGAGITGAYASRTTDGGQTWAAAQRFTAINIAVSEPRICTDAGHVHITWLRGGVLDYIHSTNGGTSWSNPPIELSDSAASAATEPAIACAGVRIFAAYVVGGNSVWVARITASGAVVQRSQVSTATVNAGSPCISYRDNYVFTAWRNDDVGTGFARIVHALSTDLGQTYTTPVGFGDGNMAQEQPQLLVDGARMLLFWLDHRGAPSLYSNRNLP
ncbi:MAG: IPT/TIG domain-containing protein, partial [Planctomycetes bacterium]|nr:IPT/TIG domain-containing protein [Planctomycetota bacterium]